MVGLQHSTVTDLSSKGRSEVLLTEFSECPRLQVGLTEYRKSRTRNSSTGCVLQTENSLGCENKLFATLSSSAHGPFLRFGVTDLRELRATQKATWYTHGGTIIYKGSVSTAKAKPKRERPRVAYIWKSLGSKQNKTT